jgi:hypothetical protein
MIQQTLAKIPEAQTFQMSPFFNLIGDGLKL